MTWDVPERNEVHLSQFSHVYTLPATCSFISGCVYIPPSGFFQFQPALALLLGLINAVHLWSNTQAFLFSSLRFPFSFFYRRLYCDE